MKITCETPTKLVLENKKISRKIQDIFRVRAWGYKDGSTDKMDIGPELKEPHLYLRGWHYQSSNKVPIKRNKEIR